MNNALPQKKKFDIIFRRILLTAGFLAFLHIFYFSIKYIFDQRLKAGYIFHNSTFLVFSVSLLILGTAGFLLSGLTVGSKRLSMRNYIIITAVVSFTLRLAFILLFKSTPISDFWLLYRSGEEVVKGNFDFVKKAAYFLSWVYQIGFVTYQALAIKLFGPGYLALKILNAAYSTGICLLIYLTGKRVFNETTGRIAGLAYCFYPASIYMCAVLTNQILSAFLFYLAMYLAVGRLQKRHIILLGLLIALGNIIRPEGPVILAAVFIYLLIFKKDLPSEDGFLKIIPGSSRPYIRGHQRQFIRGFIRPILKKGSIIAGILITFFIITKLFDTFIINTGISDYPLSNRDPLWKFIVGLSYDNKGLYNVKDFAYVSKFPLGSQRSIEEIKLIEERTRDKRKLLSLMQIKMRIFLSDFDHALATYVTPGTHLTPLKINVLLYLEKCYYTVISMFMLVSFGFLFFSKNLRSGYILYLIFILGFFFIYLFIEIQIRYRYLAMPSFLILSSYGIYSLSIQIKNYYNRIKSIDA